MAIGDEIRKSFASDAATYNAAVQTRQIGSADAVAMASVITNPKKARPTAITKTAVTSADISTKTAAAIDTGNRPHVCLNVETTTATGSITLALAKYDTAAAFLGLSTSASFSAQGVLRNGAAGKYVCESQIFDVGDASWVEPVVLAINDTSTDIYMTVL